jgi:LPXTG-motif cell wall-anchored protein
MSRSRAVVALLALVLALPSAALAQGAGDEQYGDPFGDEQAQNGGGGASQDDGLDPEPPVDPAPPEDPAPEPEPDPGEPDPAPEPDEPALPNTGSDPRILAFVGLLFVMTGIGVRLRTLDPDDF